MDYLGALYGYLWGHYKDNWDIIVMSLGGIIWLSLGAL